MHFILENLCNLLLIFRSLSTEFMKISITVSFLAIVSLVSCSASKKKETRELITAFTQYSQSVKDTFHITVQVPKGYYRNPDKRYPVVVLLDGNFYFPMMSPVLHQYAMTDMLPPAILVGVGYRSFKIMDSLRNRDYLYPKALPSDEVKSEGGGPRFKEYLTHELLTKVDAEFRTQKENRILCGHSFGGYFVLYCLLDQLKNKSTDFKTFISASPSLWYNDFYLKNIPQELKKTDEVNNLNIFITVGSKEDSTWSVKPVNDFTGEIQKLKLKGTKCESRIYNYLEHMDVGVISFTKGLQEFLKEDNGTK